MMIVRWILALILVILLAFSVQARETGGVVLPETLGVGADTLVLNGAGLRKKLFIKVYAAGLYLKAPDGDANRIIQGDEAMAVRMHFIYDGVSGAKLVKGWNEGFARATDGETDAIKAGIDRFNSFFTDEAKAGEVYDIIYLPGEGVRVFMRGALRGTVPGLAFKQALFAVWLGDAPADDGLKKAMLAK